MIREKKNMRCKDKDEKGSKDTTRWDKLDGTGKRRKTKKIPKQDQTIHQKRTFQNNERKFYEQLGRERAKTVHEKDAREAKRFWNTVLEGRDHNKEVKWIDSMEKELQIVGKSLRWIYTSIHSEWL